jgi:hypothetical protein
MERLSNFAAFRIKLQTGAKFCTILISSSHAERFSFCSDAADQEKLQR